MTKCVSLLLYRETLSIEMAYSILLVFLCVCVSSLEAELSEPLMALIYFPG